MVDRGVALAQLSKAGSARARTAPEGMELSAVLREVALPTGDTVSALGQGTWRMAEDATRRGTEIEALRLGLELGHTVIDTAEMYGEGAAEELVAEAIEGHREMCS